MMSQPDNDHVEITETKATRLAEFLTTGDWRFHSYFELIGKVYHDGFSWQPVEGLGEVNGTPVGKLFSCAYCCAGIQYHYAIQDRKTGLIVSLGMECINHLEDDKAVAIIKGLESLKRKIKTDFKRKIHHKQMIQFLNDNLDELASPRRKLVAEKLESNPKHYWLSESYSVAMKSGKVIDMKRTVWEQSNNAETTMIKELTYWEILTNDFKVRCWNPKTMIPIIEEMIKKDGLTLQVPKLRALTDSEESELRTKVFREIEEYQKRVAQK